MVVACFVYIGPFFYFSCLQSLEGINLGKTEHKL